MKEIINLIKLDFVSVKGKTFIPTAGLWFFGILFGMFFLPQSGILFITGFSFLLFQPTFSIAEKNEYNKLYGTLSVNKKNIVIARFLENLLTTFSFNMLTIILAVISDKTELFNYRGLDNIKDLKHLCDSLGLSISVCAAVSFVFVCFCYLIYMIDFIWGVDKEALITILFAIAFAGLVLFFRYVLKTHITEKVYMFFKDLHSDHAALFLISMYAIGFAITALYTVISYTAVRKREL